MSRQSYEQLRLGARWRLARQLRAALAGDVLDDDGGVTILVGRKLDDELMASTRYFRPATTRRTPLAAAMSAERLVER